MQKICPVCKHVLPARNMAGKPYPECGTVVVYVIQTEENQDEQMGWEMPALR